MFFLDESFTNKPFQTDHMIDSTPFAPEATLEISNEANRMNICACIINIQVPHEVNNQRAIAKRTSQIMKYGQDVIIQIGQMYFGLLHLVHIS